MKVVRAATAGFCMGVSLALQRLDRALEEQPARPTRTLGPIIHNPQVLADYEQRGVFCIDGADGVREGDRIVIRAHGIPQDLEEAVRSRGAVVVDATCPKVKKAQLAIARATRNGEALLLFGEAAHPEVRGLVSYARGAAHIFGDEAALVSLAPDAARAYVLASQTTQHRGTFERIKARLQERLPHLEVLSTICDATRERQDEARRIAAGVDAMVVVGGRSSGNTRRLAELAAESGIPAYHVESAAELDRENFQEKQIVGLTAGASTPKSLIDEAQAWLEAR